MKRLTKSKMEYKSNLLVKLQAYENIGLTPEQIVERLGIGKQEMSKDFDLSTKHDIKLLNATDKPRNLVVNVDGEKMGINDFCKAIGMNPTTVKGWVRERTFFQRLREKGIV